MPRLTILALFALAITTLMHGMDAQCYITEMPSEIINVHIVQKVELREKIALIQTCKHFNDTIVRSWMNCNITPEKYDYVIHLMEKKVINLNRMQLSQLSVYDFKRLFKAANALGLPEIAIECNEKYHPLLGSYCPENIGCQSLSVLPLFNDNEKIRVLAFAGKVRIDVNDLCIALRKNSSLTELEFCNTRLPGKDIRDILRAVNRATNIKTLDLNGNPLPEAELNALRTNTSLTSLGLTFCRLDNDNAAESLITFIRNNTKLRMLKFSHAAVKTVYDKVSPVLEELRLRTNANEIV